MSQLLPLIARLGLVLVVLGGAACSQSAPVAPAPLSASAAPTVSASPIGTVPPVTESLSEALQQLAEADHNQLRSPYKLKMQGSGPVVIVEDYAIVDWTSGDAVGQTLLQQKSGKWQVINRGFGEPFSEAAGLAQAQVPKATVQTILSRQSRHHQRRQADRADACLTFIDDPNPPTNVRSEPVLQPENIVGQLNPLDVIEVVNSQGGWLEIRQPRSGWVALNLTHVSCGSIGNSRLEGINSRTSKLRQQGLDGDRAAIDLLIRYLDQDADGAPAEAASAHLGEILEKQPQLAIKVFDAQPEALRRSVLRMVALTGLTPQGRKIWEARLAEEARSATAQTWATLQRSPK